MHALNRTMHNVAVAVGRVGAKFLPDRVPVTFVGDGAVAELCESIAHSGVDRALIVTDAMLVELGIVGQIVDALQAVGVASSVFSGVEPDPTFPQVEAGLVQLEADHCGAVVAVGGGSPMDAAKMIAALATNGRPLDKLEGMFKLGKAPLPVYAVPTTAGTGSEVTVAAVLSDPDSHEKKFYLDPKLMPVMAALDPGLMTGLPPAITAATGMDALTHAVESFIAKTATPQSKAYATIAVRLVFRNLPKAFSDGSDRAARKAMALASYYAGLAFTRTSVGYVHAIAHAFGRYYRTPHGLANAIALPHVLELSKVEAEGPLARLAEIIGLEAASDSERAAAFIQAVRDLMQKIDIPSTLKDLRTEDIATIAEQARAEVHLNYPVPRYISQDECVALLHRIVA